MRTRPFTIVGILTVTLFAIAFGCDRKSETPSKPSSAAAIDVLPISPSSATTTTSNGPQSSPPTSASAIDWPNAASMVIDQKKVEFPAAKLRLTDAGGNKVTALLFSDDPKDAISDTYAGNSFYFEMDLDLDSPASIGEGRWTYRSTTEDRDDTPFGIFLEGHRRQLQPLEVKIDFDDLQESPTKLTTVWISGRFLSIDLQDESAPQKVVTLAAHLVANTSVRK